MDVTGLTERQSNVARLLGRGYSQRHAAYVEGVGRGTIVRWLRDPVFVAEVERARENRLNPTPRGTLIEAAYNARKDDGIDWATRVRAVMALADLDRESDDPDEDVEPAGWVT